MTLYMKYRHFLADLTEQFSHTSLGGSSCAQKEKEKWDSLFNRSFCLSLIWWVHRAAPLWDNKLQCFVGKQTFGFCWACQSVGGQLWACIRLL